MELPTMATEGFLLHDGGQCTAAVNLSQGASLSGFGGSGQFLGVSITAARAVTNITASTTKPYGILQNDPTSGFVADVGVFGITKAVAGASITAGNQLMFDSSGRVITYTTPGTNEHVGIALEAATAANQVIAIFLQPKGLQP
jgi:hypothetical protein